MTQDIASLKAIDQPNSELPYARSWIDQIVQGVAQFPGPSWLFYLVALFAFALLGNAVFWLDGSLLAGSFSGDRLAESVYFVFFVALYHHLSLVAARSLRGFRPALRSSDAELRAINYRLTTLPRGLGWLAIVLGIALTISFITFEPGDFGLDVANGMLPVLYQYGSGMFQFAAFSALLIQTLRQLRLVNDLHREAPEINLFRLAPAHAFASLTARAAIGLAIFIVFSGLAFPSGITDIFVLLFIAIGLLAVAVFVIPLIGMRQRLGDEKVRLLGETDRRILVTIGRIHDRVDSSEHEELSGLNTTMNVLITERDLIAGISTLPWQPSTLRGFATTLLLPIFLWLVTRLLERLI